VQHIEWAVTRGGVRRSSIAHEKEGYLKIPIRMGVVNQVRESRVKVTVSPFHYPITFGMIAGGVDPLDPQHLASLVIKRGHESSALAGNQDRTRAMSSDDFSSIYSCTDFRRLIWYGEYLCILGEMVYKRQ